MELLRKKILLVIVFLTGGAVLLVEIVAARILAPLFGNTIYSYSSIISVILAALSGGYYCGGRLADKFATEKIFYSLIFFSGVLVCAIEFLSATFITPLSLSLSLVTGPLIASCILFFAPSFLLGMLSPYAIKLQSLREPEYGVGRISGEVFFASTLGSIAGSLSAGFLLIPNFGIQIILLMTGAILMLLGLVGTGFHRRQKNIAFMIIAVASLLAAGLATQARFKPNIIFDGDGTYEHLTVFDGNFKNHPTRFLRSDINNSSAIFLDSDEPVFEYVKFFDIYKAYDIKPKKILVLGSGAYTLPRYYLKAAPEAGVYTVEIEPKLYELSKKYFRLEDDPRLHIITADARKYITESDDTFDVIYVDLFLTTYSVPVHCATQEFFEVVKKRLSPQGVLIVNLIGDLYQHGPSLTPSFMATLGSVFSGAQYFTIQDLTGEKVQNIPMVLRADGQALNFHHPYFTQHSESLLRELEKHLVDVSNLNLAQQTIFTDNYAPVEQYGADMLKRYFAMMQK